MIGVGELWAWLGDGAVQLRGARPPRPALAHPHVWITAKAEIVYAADGRVSAVRRIDLRSRYSSYITQGLDKNGDGKLTPDELQDLAKENAESLSEFGYFTVLKANGAKPALEAPRDYGMTVENGRATLAFVLRPRPSACPRSA